MNNLLEEFPFVNEEVWLAKVKAELKEKLASYKWNNELEVNPLNRNSVMLPSISNRSNDWIVCQEINAERPFDINSEMHEALLGGASGISLKVNYNWVFSDFETIFKEIELSFIHLRFDVSANVSKTDFLEHFEKYLLINNIANINVSFVCNDNSVNSLLNQKLKLEIIEGSSVSLSERLSLMLIEAEKNVFTFNNKISFVIRAEENFYVNIAKIKALNIIWQKILIANNLHNPEYLAPVFVEVEVEAENPNKLVIAYNNMILSSAIAGANLIQAKNINYEDEVSSARITRNIHLIFQEEGYLNTVIDASKGSYLIDNICTTIIEKTWDLFLKNIE